MAIKNKTLQESAADCEFVAQYARVIKRYLNDGNDLSTEEIQKIKESHQNIMNIFMHIPVKYWSD